MLAHTRTRSVPTGPLTRVATCRSGTKRTSSATVVWRGGSWDGPSALEASSVRGFAGPTFGLYNTGFRVASVPEPGSITFVVIAACLLGYAWRQRRVK